VPVYSNMTSKSPETIACRADVEPGTLVKSLALAPADSRRIAAILPKRICSVKFLEPTPMAAPSKLISAISPLSSPVRMRPPAVPKPQLARNKVLAAVSVAITFFTSASPSALVQFQEHVRPTQWPKPKRQSRSEEHTSELQSRFDLV